MRVATIDIGTNTVLLLVAERGASGQLVAVEEHATITRLGEGVDKTRKLAPEAIERTNACLDRYAEIVARLGVDQDRRRRARARCATPAAATRCAPTCTARFGVEARTISGDEEARLTFARRAQRALAAPSGRVVVFDIGGGSTEVVDGTATTRAIAFAHSYDVGSVRLTERHVRSDPPDPTTSSTRCARRARRASRRCPLARAARRSSASPGR